MKIKLTEFFMVCVLMFAAAASGCASAEEPSADEADSAAAGGGEVEELSALSQTIGETDETIVSCDASVIAGSEIDYSFCMDLRAQAYDEAFLQELREAFADLNSEDANANLVLYGQDGCYLSVCPVGMFHAVENKMADNIYAFLFTSDLEPAGYLLFFTVDGKPYYNIVFDSVSPRTTSDLLETMSENPDEKYIVLCNGTEYVLLNEDNEAVAATSRNNPDKFQISGDYYHELDYATLAVSYNDIVNEDDLVWISFD